MEIIPFERGHVADVTRLVNAQIALVPPHWQLSEAQVWDILQKESLWEIHYADEEPSSWTWSNEIICVVDNDRVLAAGRMDYRYDDSRLGMVSGRWLVSDADHPEALGMLVDYLTAKRVEGDVAIQVNGRSDFGLGWGGVPTTDDHLNIALWVKGFTPYQKWQVMTAEISAEPPPQPSSASDGGSQAHLRWEIDESRLEWNLNLYDGDSLIGECQSWGIPPEFADCPEYNRWMQIEWLGIEEPYRHRGLGHRLLATQLSGNAWHGKMYCLLYTETDNTSAIKLYKGMGFIRQAEVWGWSWPYKL